MILEIELNKTEYDSLIDVVTIFNNMTPEKISTKEFIQWIISQEVINKGEYQKWTRKAKDMSEIERTPRH